MTEWLRLRPEPGGGIDPDIAIPTKASDGGTVTHILESVEHALAQVPTLVWIGAILTLGAATVITLPVARRRAREAGARVAGHTATQPGDRALFAAAMVPAALFLGAVLAGSFRGLTAFGRDELRWTDGWEYLVPGTLDGVALSFGFLAFRAIRKKQSPDRANRLVWAAAIASAVINYAHEARLTDGSWLAGAYLALMSVFGMLIFHEFLAQFEEGAEAVHRKTPKFGLRWITWPTNTAAAWLAWHNHPAPEGTHATIAAAVSHLEQVRAAKRVRYVANPGAPWWTPILPWARVRQLDAITAAASIQRANLADELAAVKVTVDQIREAHHGEAEALRKALVDAVETARTETAETVAELESKHAAEIARVRAESATVSLTDYRRDHSTTRRSGKASKTSPTPPLTDEQAVQMLIEKESDPAYEWSQAEVRRVTGVGFSRTDRIVTAVADYHRRKASGEGSQTPSGDGAGDLSGDGPDDVEERSA